MPLLEWIYNSNTGYVLELPTPFAEAELHSGLGWHGPFNSREEATSYYNANVGANPGWKAPTTDVGTTISNAATSGIQRATGTDKINYETWILRIGEILLGVVLIGVAIAKLSGTTNAIAKAVKVAL